MKDNLGIDPRQVILIIGVVALACAILVPFVSVIMGW